MDFSKLRSISDTSSNMAKLNQTIQALNSSPDASDKLDNLWKAEVDKSGNGMAVIRFLPAPGVDGEDSLPWIKIFSHGFKGSGGWLITPCLTTKSKSCPVCEANTELWNSGIEANKTIVRERKRKLSYYSNVYIVSDPKHPENEGKVFLFKFGKKIFDKITEAMNPDFEDEKAINPFDLWKGANFKLKIRKVEGYQNYDKSEFEAAGPLFDDDSKMEKVWKSEYSLKEIIDDSAFKSYEDTKSRMDKVLGLSGDVPTKTTVEHFKEVAKSSPKKVPVEVSDSEDSDIDYFKKLAEQD